MTGSPTDKYSLKTKLFACALTFVLAFGMCPIAPAWAEGEAQSDQPAAAQDNAGADNATEGEDALAADQGDNGDAGESADQGTESSDPAQESAATTPDTSADPSGQGTTGSDEGTDTESDVTILAEPLTVTPAKTTAVYNGTDQTPSLTVASGETALTTDEYTVEPTTPMINVGTYTITVTGAAGTAYEGTSGTVTFTITPANLSKASVGLSDILFAYTGQPIKPTAAVKLGGKTLASGTDYTITYANNVKGPSATATIKGTGNYTGTVSRKFTIANVQIAVQKTSWSGYKNAGTVAGSAGGASCIKKVKLKVSGVSGGITYRVNKRGRAWNAWAKNGKAAGKGSKKAQAIQIKLTGDIAKKFDVYYRVNVVGVGWMGWAKNNQKAGTTKAGVDMRGIQVKLVRKGKAAPGSTAYHYASRATNTDWLAKRLLHGKIANKSSSTHYIIAVNTSLNRVGVFKGHKGNWKLHKMMTAGTGKKSTPSKKGTFTVKARGLYFNTSGGHGTCWYWTQWSGDYLFHSQIYKAGSKKTLMYKNQLSKNVSHGCIRLTLSNAKWIHDTIPRGTKVVVWGIV